MRSLTTARRILLTALLTSALSASGALPLAGFVPAAHAHVSAAADECRPEDQECQDREANKKQAEKIEKQQQKTQQDSAKAQQSIDETGKDLQENSEALKDCQPGSASCMAKLAGKGEREEGGFTDMSKEIDAFRPEPADNAQEAVETTCANFPASLPPGAADEGQSPFPASKLCSLLGP